MATRFAHIIIDRVLELKEAGYTHREIAYKIGCKHEQINKLIERYNKKQRMNGNPIAVSPNKLQKNDSQKTNILKQTDLKQQLKKKDSRIKQLEMENELLRDFLKEIERK